MIFLSTTTNEITHITHLILHQSQYLVEKQSSWENLRNNIKVSTHGENES